MNRKLFHPATVILICILNTLNAYCAEPVSIDSVRIRANNIPLITNTMNNFAFTIRIYAHPGTEETNLRKVSISIDKPEVLETVKVVGPSFRNSWSDENGEVIQYFTLGSQSARHEVVIDGKMPLREGENIFQVSLLPKQDINLTEKVSVHISAMEFSSDENIPVQYVDHSFRMGTLLRTAGQDRIHTYRIPGLVTTQKGTLIAVYDIRYNNDRDLQEDIDVGMSRSKDGGQNWEPMKVIMDMGEWGGLPDSKNGIGDPSVLIDLSDNTIWVAALWVHGNYSSIQNNRFSQKGLEPLPDGSGSQLILVKSVDDGKSWSQPINITRQTKDPSWERFLQGPGRGICMTDGTLVFPAQFLDPARGNAASTIIYSRNHGQSWETGLPAIPGTSEAQVTQLSDGRLMLNMRSNQKARLVAVSPSPDQPWTVHETSAKALPEPGCMASLISTDMLVNNKMQRVLFFSNPSNTETRSHMTIKASLDNGMTWPADYQLELNEKNGYGYSCLTVIDKKTLGILYEGVRELYFQKIPVVDILSGRN